MRTKRSMMMVVAAAMAACVAMAGNGSDQAIEITDGASRWRFVPVEGTSRLPIEYMQTGQNKGALSPVSLPRFWIADKMVTEGEFAAMQGRNVRKDRKPGQPLAAVEWEDALDYCEKFTQKYSGQLPKGVIASMPTMVEWAHAVRILDGKTDLDGEVGTFLFTANQFGGFLATFGKSQKNRPDDFDPAVDLTLVAKRMNRSFVGVRLVLVAWDGGRTLVDGEQADNTMVSRGVIMVRYGLFDRAKAYLDNLLAKGTLEKDDRERAENACAFAQQDHEHAFEDWSGLVACAAAFAERNGFVSSPYAEHWQRLGIRESMEEAKVASSYAKAGIVGGWLKIGDLPHEIRADQPVGDVHSIMPYVDGPACEPVEIPITTNTPVQVLTCDFTGDGRKDIVVEQFNSVGAAGYWYKFYMRKSDGSYTNILELQTVGLCALPGKQGGACAFLDVGKESNPVLDVDLLTLKNGEPRREKVGPKAFCMLDAQEDRIYMAAPFIGAGYGLGWKLQEGRGIWYRPLFWPWKQGTVHGFEEVLRKAEKPAHARQGTNGVHDPSADATEMR